MAVDPSGRWRDWPAPDRIGAKAMHVGLPTFAALPAEG